MNPQHVTRSGKAVDLHVCVCVSVPPAAPPELHPARPEPVHQAGPGVQQRRLRAGVRAQGRHGDEFTHQGRELPVSATGGRLT